VIEENAISDDAICRDTLATHVYDQFLETTFVPLMVPCEGEGGSGGKKGPGSHSNTAEVKAVGEGERGRHVYSVEALRSAGRELVKEKGVFLPGFDHPPRGGSPAPK